MKPKDCMRLNSHSWERKGHKLNSCLTTEHCISSDSLSQSTNKRSCLRCVWLVCCRAQPLLQQITASLFSNTDALAHNVWEKGEEKQQSFSPDKSIWNSANGKWRSIYAVRNQEACTPLQTAVISPLPTLILSLSGPLDISLKANDFNTICGCTNVPCQTCWMHFADLYNNILKWQ